MQKKSCCECDVPNILLSQLKLNTTRLNLYVFQTQVDGETCLVSVKYIKGVVNTITVYLLNKQEARVSLCDVMNSILIYMLLYLLLHIVFVIKRPPFCQKSRKMCYL